MTLGLESLDNLGRRGRRPQVVDVGPPVELTMADLLEMAEAQPAKVEPVQRIRSRHHAAARQLADGATVTDAATNIGMSIGRLSTLQSDPSFRELVVFYQENRNAAYAEMHQVLAGLCKDAALELHERLEEEPESIPNGQLLDIVKAGADRTGHGPASSVNNNTNVNIAVRMEAARQRAKEIEGNLANEPISIDARPARLASDAE